MIVKWCYITGSCSECTSEFTCVSMILWKLTESQSLGWDKVLAWASYKHFKCFRMYPWITGTKDLAYCYLLGFLGGYKAWHIVATQYLFKWINKWSLRPFILLLFVSCLVHLCILQVFQHGFLASLDDRVSVELKWTESQRANLRHRGRMLGIHQMKAGTFPLHNRDIVEAPKSSMECFWRFIFLRKAF